MIEYSNVFETQLYPDNIPRKTFVFLNHDYNILMLYMSRNELLFFYIYRFSTVLIDDNSTIGYIDLSFIIS